MAFFHFHPIVQLQSMICYRRYIVVCLSDCLSACYVVHCGAQVRCTGLKVVPATSYSLFTSSDKNKNLLGTRWYTDPESHNAQRYRQSDGVTDDMMMPVADHTV